jgi:hypothetical protein
MKSRKNDQYNDLENPEKSDMNKVS